MSRRSALPWVGLGVFLFVVSLLIGRSEGEGPPLDPDSVAALGTLGLVEFMEARDIEVNRGFPESGVGTALVLGDELSPDDRDDLLDWAADGGNLVVADQASPLAGLEIVNVLPAEDLRRGVCTIPELIDVNQLAGDTFALLRPFEGDQVCFGDENRAYVARSQFGNGSVTVVGGALAFTNQNLDQADNAVLAAGLLFPQNQGVTIIYAPFAQASERTLLDLLSAGVRWFLIQLAVVAAIFLWRSGRRFGGVVHEPPVVELPGSLAVRATAELRRRAGGHETAAALIRSDTERRLRTKFKIPPDLDVGGVVETVSSQTNTNVQTLANVLMPGPLEQDGDALVRYVSELDAAISPAVTSQERNVERVGASAPAAKGISE